MNLSRYLKFQPQGYTAKIDFFSMTTSQKHGRVLCLHRSLIDVYQRSKQNNVCLA
ncbi:unnamed protein product [Acanthoscelides obtectus]|uniref:Uncharacterized protein n=1 Tax=Acanthoscelides obtectus TaxID=200917 RepID=A0A9P0PSI3_ACAOB|nr:unnamed protein product [Acanthoscelides obtectus]CAK1679903.1 hypothetical protein AOBTE_LOCUS32451 [Acanthoscelides obtectus]